MGDWVGRQEMGRGGVLTLGLLRGLEDRPVDAPLTERDLQHIKTHAEANL